MKGHHSSSVSNKESFIGQYLILLLATLKVNTSSTTKTAQLPPHCSTQAQYPHSVNSNLQLRLISTHAFHNPACFFFEPRGWLPPFGGWPSTRLINILVEAHRILSCCLSSHPNNANPIPTTKSPLSLYETRNKILSEKYF